MISLKGSTPNFIESQAAALKTVKKDRLSQKAEIIFFDNNSKSNQ